MWARGCSADPLPRNHAVDDTRREEVESSQVCHVSVLCGLTDRTVYGRLTYALMSGRLAERKARLGVEESRHDRDVIPKGDEKGAASDHIPSVVRSWRRVLINVRRGRVR